MRVHTPSAVAVLALFLAGCNAERAEFTHREEMEVLAPEVQVHVRDVLQRHFGTPVDMVAWERLPIRYHAARGSVTDAEGAVADGNPGAQLRVSLTEQNRSIESGQLLTFLSGDFFGAASAGVQSFDPSSGRLTINEDGYPSAPAEGDRVVIGPGAVLEQGRVLYAEHCQHCHGVSGDGRGPTAPYLNPPPRDYRLGTFKFTSTNTSFRASRDDLQHTIVEGIPGTYMPSFKLLTDEELQAVTEYILWLSMRGEIEYRQIQALRLDYSEEAVDAAVSDLMESSEGLSRRDARQQVIEDIQEYLQGDWQEEFDSDTQFLAQQWRDAQEESAMVFPKSPRVPDTPESRAEGRRLYLGAKAQCATCHGPQGLGDGGQTRSVQKNTETNTDFPLPGLYDSWGNPLKPRDLTRGIYRGGRRPLDVYRRVYAGIKGTPMPAFGTVLTDEEIWHIVNYVMHMPYEVRDRRPGEGAHDSVAPPAEVAVHQPAEAAH